MAATTPQEITEEVVRRFAAAPDPRLRRLMQSLVSHLHAFAIDNGLTEPEWHQAVAFLTETGQACTDVRQEVILLSDTLGLSMVVDAINHPAAGGATESTVLGPFHAEGAPWREMGADLACRPEDGEPTDVSGTVTGREGEPIAGAVLDVWQNSATGRYAVEDASQPPDNLRGRFRTGDDGRYWFRTVLPTDYTIPADGPVGRMLAATGRHPWRPAHLHLLVSAPGYRTVATHVFDGRSPYLDSDAVFGVKASLVAEFVPVGDPGAGARYELRRDIVLAPATGTQVP